MGRGVDYRWLYLLQRHEDGTVSEVMSRRVLFAYRKEQRLHAMFSASRFTWTRRVRFGAWAQGHYKIGIATNVGSRISSINRDPTKSGQTEWFALNDVELACVMGWLLWYKARPWVNGAALVVLAVALAACCLIQSAAA